MESPSVKWCQKTEQESEVRSLNSQPSQLWDLNKVKFIELLDHGWHIESLHAPWHLLLQVGLLGLWAAALLCCIIWTLLVSTKFSLLQPNYCFLSPWPFSPLLHCSLILVCCPCSQPAPTLLLVSTSKSYCSFRTCLFRMPSPTQGSTSQLDTITPSPSPRSHILLARLFFRYVCFVSGLDRKLSWEGCMSRSVFPQCWPHRQGVLDARWSMNEGLKE